MTDDTGISLNRTVGVGSSPGGGVFRSLVVRESGDGGEGSTQLTDDTGISPTEPSEAMVVQVVVNSDSIAVASPLWDLVLQCPEFVAEVAGPHEISSLTYNRKFKGSDRGEGSTRFANNTRLSGKQIHHCWLLPCGCEFSSDIR